MIRKEEVEKNAQIKRECQGVVFESHSGFIRKKKGQEGLKAVEKKTAEMGYPVNFKKINTGGWYPEFLSVLVILTAKHLFNWTEKDIFEMGNLAPKYTFIAKILMEYFLSFKRFMAEVPKYWRKHLDFGELEIVQFDEEKRYIIIREKGYRFHPIMCIYHAGYCREITKYIVKSEKISVEETKCIFKGDPYHEYVIRWK